MAERFDTLCTECETYGSDDTLDTVISAFREINNELFPSEGEEVFAGGRPYSKIYGYSDSVYKHAPKKGGKDNKYKDFAPHFSKSKVDEGLANGTLLDGQIRLNAKSENAYVTIHGVNVDI